MRTHVKHIEETKFNLELDRRELIILRDLLKIGIDQVESLTTSVLPLGRNVFKAIDTLARANIRHKPRFKE